MELESSSTLNRSKCDGIVTLKVMTSNIRSGMVAVIYQSLVPVMNKKLLLPALAILAVFGLCQRSVVAAPVTFNTGDIFVGFETTGATGTTINLLVDIGSNYSTPLTNTINLASDLSAKYGTNWFGSASVYYGVFGIIGTGTYGGAIASTPAGQTGLPNKSSGAAATMISDYSVLGSQYNTDKNNNQTLSNSVYQNTATENQGGTWSYYSPSTTPFATYNKSIETLVGSNLDLWSMSTVSSGTGTKIETITLSSAGLLEVVSVPEPGTYALLSMSAIALLIVARRRQSDSATA